MQKPPLSKNHQQFLKKFNYVFIGITALWLIIGAVILFDIYQDRKMTITLKEPVEFFADNTLTKATLIGTIKPNNRIKVLRVLDQNNRFVIQIENSSGQIGWILKPENINLKNEGPL